MKPANNPQSHPLAGRRALKMNGLGNEIVVLDLRGAPFRVGAAEARAIGAAPGLHFDQLMVLSDPARPDAQAAMKIFNIDGSVSAACGNGTRCVGWALVHAGAPDAMLLESDAGLLSVKRMADTQFQVDMGAPHLRWNEIPLAGAGGDTAHVLLTPPAPGAPAMFTAVSMGNPHAVFFVDDVQAMDLGALGPQIERHPLFPERVNASFAQMLARDHIALRVWERGAGATRACGTAACASAVAAARTGLGARKTKVTLPGGDLAIHWRESDDHVLMTGPVEFEHESRLDAALFA
ncbi:MAG: diaminopimelate epimerase [Hyphomicrobiales bacterium]|nr:diaminopimelate epimerase [Hyphomicrobiales bacterium]